jgi:CRP/FNR family nitrogen fixation transcriptional regulator
MHTSKYDDDWTITCSVKRHVHVLTVRPAAKQQLGVQWTFAGFRTVILLVANKSGGIARLTKQSQLPVEVWADPPSKQTLKSALAALRSGPIRFRRDQVIACEGDQADYVFLVVRGVVRSCRTFENGERSVVAFYLPGDLFGWDGQTRPFSIEAASDVTVTLIKRRGLTTLAESNPRLTSFLHSVVLNELQRTKEYAVTIKMSAKNRFLAFLRDWLRRSGASNSVRLQMGYQDIADHLGIKIETLSRTITELERSGALARTSSRRGLTLMRI